MTRKWHDFVKVAVSASTDGMSYRLSTGETPDDALAMFNKSHPYDPIRRDQMAGGEPALGGKHLPGRWYKFSGIPKEPKIRPGSALDYNTYNSYIVSGAPKGMKLYRFDMPGGMVGTTPRLARQNLYRYASILKYGPKYDDARALSLADEDMSRAQKARHADLVGRGIAKEPFDPGKNYMIRPGGTYSPPKPIPYGKAVDAGSVDSVIPLKYGTRDDGRGFTATSFLPDDKKIDYIDVGRFQSHRDPFLVYLHEGGHSFMPVYRTSVEDTPPPWWPKNVKHYNKGTVSWWGLLDDDAKRTSNRTPGYAASPWERMVGVGWEKAKMRVAGDDGSFGMGRRWAAEQLRDRAKSQKAPPGKQPAGVKSDADWRLNSESLRQMLFDLYDKADRAGATKEDRIKYQDFLNDLDRDFELASIDRPRPGSGRGMAVA